MRKLFLLLSISYVMLSACTGDKHTAAFYASQLDSINHNLQRGIVDTTRVQSLTNDIELYVNKNNADTAAPKLLFNLALTQEGHRMNEPAVKTLRELRERYPDSEFASKALMLQGYVYANELKNYDAARNAYNEYLLKYRNVDANVTRDVEMELQTMGKTPDQIMAEIEARNAADTLSTQRGAQ